jgi:hypothetical protein
MIQSHEHIDLVDCFKTLILVEFDGKLETGDLGDCSSNSGWSTIYDYGDDTADYLFYVEVLGYVVLAGHECGWMMEEWGICFFFVIIFFILVLIFR